MCILCIESKELKLYKHYVRQIYLLRKYYTESEYKQSD